MDERTTWDASDEVLQLVSGRQVCVTDVAKYRPYAKFTDSFVAQLQRHC